MDKETLSKYGWVVIVIIILVILMSFAAPFGNYFSNGFKESVHSLTKSMNSENIQMVDEMDLYYNYFSEPIDYNTYYTANDISKNRRLYAIGATNVNYVVAEFNEGYTEVVISKNIPSENAESDGKMARSTVAMYNKLYKVGESTLTTIRILEGVTNIGNETFTYHSKINTMYIPKSVTLIEYSNWSGKHITVYGERDSYAETWAAQFGFTFVETRF